MFLRFSTKHTFSHVLERHFMKKHNLEVFRHLTTRFHLDFYFGRQGLCKTAGKWSTALIKYSCSGQIAFQGISGNLKQLFRDRLNICLSLVLVSDDAAKINKLRELYVFDGIYLKYSFTISYKRRRVIKLLLHDCDGHKSTLKYVSVCLFFFFNTKFFMRLLFNVSHLFFYFITVLGMRDIDWSYHPAPQYETVTFKINMLQQIRLVG